jgi:uncharacterized protein YdcH (DUF465 family)
VTTLTEDYRGRRLLVDYDEDDRPEDQRVAVFQQYVSLSDEIESAEGRMRDLQETLAKLRDQREDLRDSLLRYLGGNAPAPTKGLPF